MRTRLSALSLALTLAASAPALLAPARAQAQPALAEAPAAVADGLPATRQLHEGYWLGAMIDVRDVPGLARLGVRLVISAVDPGDATARALEDAGIEQLLVPIGSRFRHAQEILEAVARYRPDEVFIHCRYGADRTGAIAAFLLVMRHGWLIPDAFYSVLYPTDIDAAGLAEVLARYDIPDPRDPADPTVGYYSVSAAGGTGGLKTRSSQYAELVETTIDAIESIEAR